MQGPPLLKECWLHCFSYLGPCTLLNLACVSRAFCALARDERVWERHAARVLRELGEFRSAEDHVGWPTWRAYRQVLLTPWRACAKDMLIGTWDARPQAPLRRRSICKAVFPYSTMSVGVDLGVLDDFHGYRPYCVAYPTPQQRLFNAWEVPVPGFAPTRFVETPLTLFGLTCVADTDVDPAQWGRFHTVVRDNDAQCVREDRTWLTFRKTAPE